MHSSPQTKTNKSPEKSTDKALLRGLVEAEKLSVEQAKKILWRLKSQDEDKTVEQLLVEMELVNEDEILETKASLWNVPFIDLNNYEIDPEVLDLVPGSVARQYQFFPLFRIDGTLLIAMTDPKNVRTIDKVTEITQLEVSPALSGSQAVSDAITRYYGESDEESSEISNDEIQDILEVIEAEESKEEDVSTTQDLERQAEEAPVVKMTNMVLIQSILEGASDVHFNPEEGQLRVRF
jgi:type IV pilus assembly protein PilB